MKTGRKLGAPRKNPRHYKCGTVHTAAEACPLDKAVMAAAVSEVIAAKAESPGDFVSVLKRFQGVQDKLLGALEERVANGVDGMNLEEINAALKVCRENIVSLQGLDETGADGVIRVVTRMSLEEK